jgi:hypothetical protein
MKHWLILIVRAIICSVICGVMAGIAVGLGLSEYLAGYYSCCLFFLLMEKGTWIKLIGK